MTVKHFFILFCFSISYLSQANPRLIYKKTPDLVSADAYVSYFTDSTGRLTFEEVQKNSGSIFTPNTKDFLNFGNMENPVWIKLDLENLSGDELYLMQELHDVRMLDVYLINTDRSVRSWFTGSMRPFGSHFLKRNTTVFDLGRKPATVFLRVHNPNIYLPVKIGSLQAVNNYLHHYDLFYGLIYGILIALILYNLFLFLMVKDRLFLYYFFYIVSSGYIILRADNHHQEFLFGQIPSFTFDINLSSTICIFFTLIFANSYLRIKETAPVFFRILACLMLVGILFLPSEWLPYKAWVNDLYQLLYMVIMVVLFICSVYIHFIGFRPARFFILAFGFYIFGVVNILLGFYGVRPMNTLSSAYIYQLCSVAEALLFSLAVAYRFNTYRKEATDARELALKSAQEHEELLLKNTRLLAEKLHVENNFREHREREEVEKLILSLEEDKYATGKISIPTIDGIILFPQKDISRLEAMGSYCTIHLSNNKKITTSRPMAHFGPMLDPNKFMRTHKSHIVNLDHVVSYIRGEGGSVELRGNVEVPVSRRLKKEVVGRLTDNTLPFRN